MIRRPPTERERQIARFAMAAYEALRPIQRERISLVEGRLIGHSPLACPGPNGSSGHVGRCLIAGPHRHAHFHTNHPISPRVVEVLDVIGGAS